MSQSPQGTLCPRGVSIPPVGFPLLPEHPRRIRPCSPPAEPFPFFPRSLELFPQTLSVICTSLQKQGAQNKMQCSRWNLTIALNNQVTTSHRLLPAPPPPHGSALPRLHRIPGSIPPRALSIQGHCRAQAFISCHLPCPRSLPRGAGTSLRCLRPREGAGAVPGLVVRCSGLLWRGAGNAGFRHFREFPALHTFSSGGLG